MVPRAAELLHELAVVQHVVVGAGQLLLELADVQQMVNINKASQLAQYSYVLGHVEGLRSKSGIPAFTTVNGQNEIFAESSGIDGRLCVEKEHYFKYLGERKKQQPPRLT